MNHINIFHVASEGAGDGVKVTAEKVFSFGNFPITNSMVTSWVISLFLVLFVKIPWFANLSYHL